MKYEAIINIYADLIKKGLKKIEDVPKLIRKQVKEAIENEIAN